MLKILIVEDEVNLLKLMKIRLEKNGFNVLTATNGEEALKLLFENSIDLIITDIMMPVMDGYTFVKTIRKQNVQLPVIMATAKGDIEDKTAAFNLGIDDYIVKPINYDELLLRVNALLRRVKISNERKIVIGDLIIDYDGVCIKKGDEQPIVLPKKEFLILFKLLSSPDKLFTKQALLDEFWGLNSDSDEDTIKVHINRIRNKIQPFPEIDIITIRGLGYKGVKHEK